MTFDLLTSEMNSRVLSFQFKSFVKISIFEQLKIDSESDDCELPIRAPTYDLVVKSRVGISYDFSRGTT